MLENIQANDESAKELKLLSKYLDNWGNMEQDVDENTQKYQADMKIQNKELKRVQIYCEELLRKTEL